MSDPIPAESIQVEQCSSPPTNQKIIQNLVPKDEIIESTINEESKIKVDSHPAMSNINVKEKKPNFQFTGLGSKKNQKERMVRTAKLNMSSPKQSEKKKRAIEGVYQQSLDLRGDNNLLNILRKPKWKTENLTKKTKNENQKGFIYNILKLL
jgi:glucan-binding YG repeat protein